MKRRAPGGRSALSRRSFLKYSSAGVGLMLGAEPWLKMSGRADARGGNRPTELRTYFFDFSHVDTSQHDIVLVAGARRVPLRPSDPRTLSEARAAHPILGFVLDAHITHQVTLPMPQRDLQLCYVQRKRRGARDGHWDMATLFYHFPLSALAAAEKRARQAGRPRPVTPKWQRFGLTSQSYASVMDFAGESMVVTSDDQAAGMIASHPEAMCVEPNSAGYIGKTYIEPNAGPLAFSLNSQGFNTDNPTWQTQQPIIDPDTGQPYQNSQGENQYVFVWSAATNQAAGAAISACLVPIKDDPTLGVDVTGIDPTSITTGDPNAPGYGAIWSRRDGVTAVAQPSSPAPTMTRQATSALTYTFADQSPDSGYVINVTNVGTDSSGNISITFEAINSYDRHLGLWVRYLAADGSTIPLSDSRVSGVVNSTNFPNAYFADGTNLNTPQDAFIDLLGPEIVVLGIPVKHTTATETFPLPSGASSALILASGLGESYVDAQAPAPSYSATLDPGKILTIVFELALPSVFVALNAGSAYAGMIAALSTGTQIVIAVIQLTISLLADEFAATTYGDSSSFENVGVQVAAMLLKLIKGAASGGGKSQLVTFIEDYLSQGEADASLEDAIPLIGPAINAVVALGTAAGIVETAVEVAQSPGVYVGQIKFTHNVTVTISHAPSDPAGFPATATSYTVTLTLDGGTPYTQTGTLTTTQTTSIPVTFPPLPAGGNVTASVAFLTCDGTLIGKGSVGPVANDATQANLQLAITIEELLFPLTASTTYTQKEIITLDSNGNHVWTASTTPPAVVTPSGLCESSAGQLCSLTDITVSTINAEVGYSWQGADTCGGSVNQFDQFAGLSITQSPQTGQFSSGCFLAGTTRIVYDLMGTLNRNFYLDPSTLLLRQIRLTAGGAASFDGPNSNLAWGKLRFSSDALLLHPQGTIISLNAANNKFEVLDLPSGPSSDATAPLSYVYSGIGTRPGRMNQPIHGALAPNGTILVLEAGLTLGPGFPFGRIQAFDQRGNPYPQFTAQQQPYFVPLVNPNPSNPNSPTPTYLDLAVEYTGYMYVLSYTGTPGSYVYRLDVYTPNGNWLFNTLGVTADKLTVGYWRDVFTLNYQVLTLNGTVPAVTEPSVGHWIPTVAGTPGCPS